MTTVNHGPSRLLGLLLPAAVVVAFAACADPESRTPCETDEDCGAAERCSDAMICEPRDPADAGDVGGDVGGDTGEESCGDGIVSGTERCDSAIPAGQPGACPDEADCQALSADCDVHALVGTACQRACEVVDVITEPAPTADLCCPDGASANDDPDCASVCGNGEQEPGEACDDGAQNGEPGLCNRSCSGLVPLGCGNGVVEDGEACDDGVANSDTRADACRTDCSAARCGDGVRDAGEVCDDGAQNGQPNRCATTCQGLTPSVCGNGVSEAGETCDDGAQNGQPNRCATTCQGLTPSVCGNSVVEAGETCDDGAQNGQPNRCATTCQSLTPSVCGNGIIEAGEDCDDAGESATCNASCTFAVCGDGVLNASAGEACDDGAANSDTAPNACRTDCREPTCGDGVADAGEACDTAGNSPTCNANCTPAVCGDGILNPAAGEGCDDGAANSDTVPDACRTVCVRPFCGDGTVDSGEACDDGVMNGEPEQCNFSCTGITQGICGNGIIEGDEQCDDGVGNSNTTPDACRENCRLPTCGDGVADSSEACDDGAANSDTVPDACRTTCTEPVCGDGVVDESFNESCDDGPLNGQPFSCADDCSGPTPAICGNGLVEAGEACDDGDDNGAPNRCSLECDGVTPPVCGNGVVEATEACDDAGESSTCNDDCSFSVCGDGVLNVTAAEACDDGALNSDTRADACRTDCSLPVCGDGVVDSGEACDDGVNDGSACAPDCTLPADPALAFRLTSLNLLAPEIWHDAPSCVSVRAEGRDGVLPGGINGLTNDGMQVPDASDRFVRSLAVLFRSGEPDAGPGGDLELHAPECSLDAPLNVCEVLPASTATPAAYENRTSGFCLAAIPAATSPTPEGWFDNTDVPHDVAALPAGTAATPCFVSDPVSLNVNLGSVVLPLTSVRLAAVYGDDPSEGLVTGYLRGFVTAAAADATSFVASTPLVGGRALSSVLHGGPGSCQATPARDSGPAPGGGTTPGWWFYLSFTAELVDWVE